MKKNVAGQKWTVFAFDRTDNTPKTGDGGNITANVRIDGVQNAVDDTNPTEQEDGFYIFTITAAESNGDHLVICPASETENIQVIGVPGSVWTTQEQLLTDALVNKAIWTEADGQIEMHDDGDVSLGTIAAHVATDGTFTTRKRTVI